MKTPDEIKKGLECCVEGKCSECPYFKVCDEHLATGGDVVPAGEPLADWLALVKQLERERDAAVEVMSRYRNCDVCTHTNEGGLMCTTCKYPSLVDVYPTFRPNWQWRGAKETEPLRHGHWIDDQTEMVCSECKAVYSDELVFMNKDFKFDDPPYCPNCGAKLRGREQEVT